MSIMLVFVIVLLSMNFVVMIPSQIVIVYICVIDVWLMVFVISVTIIKSVQFINFCFCLLQLEHVQYAMRLDTVNVHVLLPGSESEYKGWLAGVPALAGLRTGWLPAA